MLVVAEDGYIMLFEGEEHVMVEWYGRTRADSGTGELEGLTGTMTITIADGKHTYDFDYMLAPGR